MQLSLESSEADLIQLLPNERLNREIGGHSVHWRQHTSVSANSPQIAEGVGLPVPGYDKECSGESVEFVGIAA